MVAFRDRTNSICHKSSLNFLTVGARHIKAARLLVIPNCIAEVNCQKIGTCSSEQATFFGPFLTPIQLVGCYLGEAFFSLDRNSNSAGCIFSLAASRVKKPARSISGNFAILPDFGGHSISNVLLFKEAGSQSPAKAQACTVLPLLCLTLPRDTKSPRGTIPVSS